MIFVCFVVYVNVLISLLEQSKIYWMYNRSPVNMYYTNLETIREKSSEQSERSYNSFEKPSFSYVYETKRVCVR